MHTNSLKFCSCKRCRAGLHTGKNVRSMVKRVTRSARRKWNLLAVQERDEEITPVSIPYTD